MSIKIVAFVLADLLLSGGFAFAGQEQADAVSKKPVAVASVASASEAVQSDETPHTREAYLTILKREAEKAGLPPDIGDAVMSVESGYDPTVIGGVGEIGLMQIRPATAAMLGFSGTTADLAKPEVNIHYGVTYLAKAWHLANGNLCRALMKYRAGHGEERMTPLSVSYCMRAQAHLASVNSPFATAALSSLPPDTDLSTLPSIPVLHHHGGVAAKPIMSASAKAGMARYRTAATSRAFWAAEESRVRAITARLEAKWHRVASLR